MYFKNIRLLLVFVILCLLRKADTCPTGCTCTGTGTDAEVCTGCEDPNYFVKTSKDACEKCPAGCKTCTSATECTACDVENGYYQNSNACPKCPAGCKTCTSDTACTACTDESKLNNGKCPEPKKSSSHFLEICSIAFLALLLF